MKKIALLLTILGTFSSMNAQVAIGKNSLTNTSVILEFADGTTSGINLPIVSTLPAASSAINGTILVDRNDAKVKWVENGTWVDLSDAGDIDALTENSSAVSGTGVLIGGTSDPIGVLELRATDKAMVLPLVASPEDSVKTPVPGMICYDTTSKSLAIFDGVKWNYWN